MAWVADDVSEAAKRATARCIPDWHEFVRNYWDRAPQLTPRLDPSAYSDLLDMSAIDHLLTDAGLRFPAVKVISNGRKLPSSSYTSGGTIGSVRVDDLVDGEAVADHFSAGATIVLASIHRYWPPLQVFCRHLEAALTHPVQVNAYLTPSWSQGLDLHWDTHDVFVLQCFGEKHWRVYSEGFPSPLRHHHRKGPIEAPGEPLIATTLGPGDCVYIPRGFVHGAETGEQASAHLTVGVLTHSWVDIFRQLMSRIEAEPELRRALPLGYARDEQYLLAPGAIKLQQVAGLVADADLACLVHDFTSNRRDPRVRYSGHAASIAGLSAVTDKSMFRRVSAAEWKIAVDDAVIVSTDTRVLKLPTKAQSAVELINSGEPFPVTAFANWLDAPGRAVLVRRFLREGLIEPHAA